MPTRSIAQPAMGTAPESPVAPSVGVSTTPNGTAPNTNGSCEPGTPL